MDENLMVSRRIKDSNLLVSFPNFDNDIFRNAPIPNYFTKKRIERLETEALWDRPFVLHLSKARHLSLQNQSRKLRRLSLDS